MNTIRIPVEVPADLEVVRESPTLHWIKVPSDGRYARCIYDPTEPHWVNDVCRQIAAAVEARKPKEPKFAVGDVVEWEDEGEFFAGRITMGRDSDGDYQVNNADWLAQEVLTLVRRAAK